MHVVILSQIGGSFVSFNQHTSIEFGVKVRGRRTGIYYCSWAAVVWLTLLCTCIYVFGVCYLSRVCLSEEMGSC